MGFHLSFLKSVLLLLQNLLFTSLIRAYKKQKWPSLWKSVNVTPIHKGGSTELSNYRPISVLPAISKILEIQFTTHHSDLATQQPM